MGKISLILPIYNEAAILQEVLTKYFADLKTTGFNYEIIAVNDGSTDGSLDILKSFAKLNRSLRVLTLDGRWGKQAAINAGMDAADDDSVAVILADVDIGNPLGIIKRIVDEFQHGEKIVYARRDKHGSNASRMLISDAVVKFSARLFGIEGKYTGKAHIALYSRAVADVIIALPDRNKFLRAMDNWVGWKIKYINYAPAYTKIEHQHKVAELKQKTARSGVKLTPRDKVREHTASLDYAYGFLACALIMLILGIVLAAGVFVAAFWVYLVIWAFFIISLFSAFLFACRGMLIKRVGILHSEKTTKIYVIESVIN